MKGCKEVMPKATGKSRPGALILALACAALGPAQAAQLMKCVAPDGSVTFTDRGCPNSANKEAVDVDIAPIGADGLRPGERRMLDRVEAREAEERFRKEEARDLERRHYNSYSERQRLKQLRSKRDDLARKADRPGLSYSQSRVIREEIRAIDAEMSRVQAPKW